MKNLKYIFFLFMLQAIPAFASGASSSQIRSESRVEDSQSSLLDNGIDMEKAEFRFISGGEVMKERPNHIILYGDRIDLNEVEFRDINGRRLSKPIFPTNENSKYYLKIVDFGDNGYSVIRSDNKYRIENDKMAHYIELLRAYNIDRIIKENPIISEYFSYPYLLLDADRYKDLIYIFYKDKAFHIQIPRRGMFFADSFFRLNTGLNNIRVFIEDDQHVICHFFSIKNHFLSTSKQQNQNFYLDLKKEKLPSEVGGVYYQFIQKNHDRVPVVVRIEKTEEYYDLSLECFLIDLLEKISKEETLDENIDIIIGYINTNMITDHMMNNGGQIFRSKSDFIDILLSSIEIEIMFGNPMRVREDLDLIEKRSKEEYILPIMNNFFQLIDEKINELAGAEDPAESELLEKYLLVKSMSANIIKLINHTSEFVRYEFF